MKMDPNKAFLKSLEFGYSLPTLSVVALKLVEMAADETCSTSDLARLIETDPALTVRLLKLANSAFFRTGQPITTLEGAIMQVGFHRLRVMALSLSLRDTFPMGRVGPMDYEKFWRSSIYRAMLAKALAQNVKSCNPEEAFTAGLTLEIGLLIFFDLLIKGEEENVNLDRESLEELLEWEKQDYHIEHRSIGETALRFWKFPESMIACQQLYGQKALEPGAPILARICEQARRLSLILFLPSHGFNTFLNEAEQSLGLDIKNIHEILWATFEKVEEIADNLKLELNREKDLMNIMAKANAALTQISSKMGDLAGQEEQKPLPSFATLKEEGKNVSQTLQAVAHEIRNPLLAVGGFAKRLASALDPHSDGGKYAQVILQEALRLEEALSKMTQEEK
ncbi:MAG: HDOD domain-containing protein [Desulfobacteraceae bacterium]|nr:MAG: HDOD domain-containing protein [Desulfobacteraceae bacterium]